MKPLEKYKLKILDLLQRYPDPGFSGKVSSLQMKVDVMATFARNELPKLDVMGQKLMKNDTSITHKILQDILICVLREHYNLPQ